MGTLIGNSGRVYAPLPINGDRGFPQAFPVVFGGATYRFRLYVNASFALVTDSAAVFDLPMVTAYGRQNLALIGFANGDQFTLKFGNNTTAAITYSNDSTTEAAAIQTALNLPAILGAGNTTAVAATLTANVYSIAFGGGLRGANAMPITGSTVPPATGTVFTTVAFNLPVPEAFLVVRVDQDLPNGASRIVFLRKVVPNVEYEAGAIALIFPVQRVAVSNLNGQGVFGSQVTGGIAPRWA